METETALVRADSTVELDAVAGVGLDLTAVIYPSNTEREDAVRLHQTLNYLCLLKLRMLIVHILNRFQNFLNSLQILLLSGVLGLKACHNVRCFHISF